LQILEKYSNIKSNDNLTSGAFLGVGQGGVGGGGVGQAGMKEQIFPFRSLEKLLKKIKPLLPSIYSTPPPPPIIVPFMI